MVGKDSFEGREKNGFELINYVFFLIASILTSAKPHLTCFSGWEKNEARLFAKTFV